MKRRETEHWDVTKKTTGCSESLPAPVLAQAAPGGLTAAASGALGDPQRAHAEPGPRPNCWPKESWANKMMVVSSHYVWGLVCYPAQANWKRHLSPPDVFSFCLPKLHESMDCLFFASSLSPASRIESVVFLCWINMPYIWTEDRMYFLVLKNEILDLLLEKALVL